MPLATLARRRHDEEPAPLGRLLLDPAGRPKTSLRWAIALAATIGFVVTFAVSADAPRSEHAVAAAAAARVAVLSAPDGTSPAGSLRRAAPLPPLAHVHTRKRRHKRAATARKRAQPPAIPAATPVATPVPTRAPVAPATPARPRPTRGAVFDSTG
jgi:hypothetical protein